MKNVGTGFELSDRMEENMNLKGRNFLKLKDFTPEEILYFIDLSSEFKQKKKQGIAHDELKGKNIALILIIILF